MKIFRNIFFFLLVSLSLLSCVTFERCKQKFGNKTDSTYIVLRDTIRISKDSLIVVLKTIEKQKIDTVFKEGRVKIHYIKTPEKTYIRADCDTVTRYINRQIKIPVKNEFGVNPLYKRGFWMLLSIVSLIILFIIYVFTRRKNSSDST